MCFKHILDFCLGNFGTKPLSLINVETDLKKVTAFYPATITFLSTKSSFVQSYN